MAERCVALEYVNIVEVSAACSRLSDSGKDAKVKGTLLSPVSSRFIFVFALSQSADPTISDPGTGEGVRKTRTGYVGWVDGKMRIEKYGWKNIQL